MDCYLRNTRNNEIANDYCIVMIVINMMVAIMGIRMTAINPAR